MKKLGTRLTVENRKRLAQKIKNGRKFDRDTGHNKKRWRRNRSLKGYSEAMRVNLKGKIRSIIKKKGNCRLLDIGCGDGHALAEAKYHFGDSIKTSGLRLYGKRDYAHFADEMVQSMIDKLHVGSLENYGFKNKFDLIVSFAGGTHYGVNAPFIIEKVANALSVGGEAHIQIKKARIPKGLFGEMESQGFVVSASTSPGRATILHISRLSKRKANLEEFIKKRLKKKINPKINTEERLAE